MVTKFKEFILESKLEYINKDGKFEFIAYHSTDAIITDFDFSEIELKSNSSTRIDGIFFSNVPQESWGRNIYKVKILSKCPAIFDLRKSRFDSLSVQEAFDALLRGDTSYIIDDLVEYANMEQNEAEKTADNWANLDLIVITNQVYAKHDIEFIVPDSYYNGNSAKMINLGKINW